MKGIMGEKMKTYNQQLKNQFEIKSELIPDKRKIRNDTIVKILLFIVITVIIACLVQFPLHRNYHDMWSWIAAIGFGAYGTLCIFSWFDGSLSGCGY